MCELQDLRAVRMEKGGVAGCPRSKVSRQQLMAFVLWTPVVSAGMGGLLCAGQKRWGHTIVHDFEERRM